MIRKKGRSYTARLDSVICQYGDNSAEINFYNELLEKLKKEKVKLSELDLEKIGKASRYLFGEPRSTILKFKNVIYRNIDLTSKLELTLGEFHSLDSPRFIEIEPELNISKESSR